MSFKLVDKPIAAIAILKNTLAESTGEGPESTASQAQNLASYNAC